MERLLARIAEEVEAEMASLQADAEREADAILERAEQDAEAQRARVSERLHRAHREAVALRTAQARRDARRRLLQARTDLVAQVAAEARAQLTALPLAEYASRLPNLAEALTPHCVDRRVRITCPPDAVLLLVGVFPDTVEIVGEEGHPAGLVMSTVESDLVIDLTWAIRLDTLLPTMLPELARRLPEVLHALG